MTKESDIQISCNDYLNHLCKHYHFRHFHVPNEGRKSIGYHLKLKKMGLKSGCPDLIVEYPPGKVLYIELKNERGRLSDAQKLWLVQSKAMDTPHFVVKGGVTQCLEQIKEIIEKNVPVRS